MVFPKQFWADWAPPSWAAFSKAVPKLNQLTDVGEVEVGTFSIEKVLALKPDLLVLAEWQYKALGSDLDRINKAGIPIVVGLQRRKRWPTRPIDQAYRHADRPAAKADKLAADYKRVADTIQARVQKPTCPASKVYIEFGNKGPAEHSVTFGKSMWVRWRYWSAATISPLLRSNSTARSILKSPRRQTRRDRDYRPRNRIEENPAAMVMGWGIPKAEAEKRLQALPNAPAGPTCLRLKTTASTPPTTPYSRTLSDSASIQFMAKAIYPPSCLRISTLRRPMDFYRQNLPVVPNGTFYLLSERTKGNLIFRRPFKSKAVSKFLRKKRQTCFSPFSQHSFKGLKNE